ncbi:peptide methionine sulfoxide reductase MsrA [Litorimonas cladophorae]|uniref:Peptide methionine sulfoxide reductase MsrA n=1 Tax=Litorimonas cladophorae TaxID=1220491 RepID=A0A918KRS5_9PROT|nr:peptide-methionine (S)-S-oxide reductase MsrA [Litorimonas cladophorae]GGX73406.1 peptide methionine sulfoxide reductase MsrA [Litorimonas cladophorae]
MSRMDLSLCENHKHYINGEDMFAAIPDGFEQVQLGFGCFWGAERILWKLDGVHVTSVGYSGGHTPKPDYRLVCTGKTGHAEMCHVVFDPTVISFDEILKVFFEHHDPTQGDRQGNDVGPQYRSAVFTYSDAQMEQTKAAIARYAEAYGRPLTTELRSAPEVYHAAEDYHQQYLAKNPQGYCMHGPTGIFCALPETVVPAE